MSAQEDRLRALDAAVEEAFADSPPPSPLPSRATGGPAYDAAPRSVSVEAAEYEREHGYPADAVRQPAGEYVVTVDAWNQPDEDAPGGTRLHGRGATVTLTAEEATRLCHHAAAEPAGEDLRRQSANLAALGERVEASRAEWEAEEAAMAARIATADAEEAAAKRSAVRARAAELQAEIAELRAAGQ